MGRKSITRMAPLRVCPTQGQASHYGLVFLPWLPRHRKLQLIFFLFFSLKTVSSNSCKSKLIKKKGFDFGVSRSVHSFPKPKWLKISHVYPYPFDHLFNVGPLIITLSHHSKTFKQTSLCVSKPQSTHSFFFKKKGKQNK